MRGFTVGTSAQGILGSHTRRHKAHDFGLCRQRASVGDSREDLRNAKSAPAWHKSTLSAAGNR